MKLQLKLYLPKNADAQVVIDKPIEFYALALDNDQAGQAPGDARGREARRSARQTSTPSRPGSVKLELIPRGVGKIEVQAVNLYHEIKVGEHVEMEVRVKNAGTRKLNNIRVFADLPLNWRVGDHARPDRLARAEQGRGRHDQVPAAGRRRRRRLRAQDQDRVHAPTTGGSNPRTRSSASTSPRRPTSSGISAPRPPPRRAARRASSSSASS